MEKSNKNIIMKNIYLLAIFAVMIGVKSNAQNVGIGTDVPAAKLHVNQTSGDDALKIDQKGNNGVGIRVSIGDPGNPPGPANTTNEDPCISATHYGTGAGAGSKSALSATSHGSDPAIIVNNAGNEVGGGIASFVAPNGTNDPVSILGYSADNTNVDYGIGVQGVGGWYGVRATKIGTNYAWTYGMYCDGDMTASGVKSFTIDYPLDPENKALRHYNIESNEVLNMYRGIVTLDANGKAIIDLPEYFDAVNINPSYQLTAIGTPTQPYVATEIANNQFTVAGTPNTKVSWTVHAQRNDPTLLYFDANGKDYASEVFDKPTKMKGKYYNPEAYEQPSNKGIHYMPEKEIKDAKTSDH